METYEKKQDPSVELRQILNAKQLKAVAKTTFNTSVGEITISGFRVLENEPGKPWVGFPQESYQKNGEWKNIPIVDVAQRGRKIISEAILSEYRRVTGLDGGADQISSRPQKGLTR